jgi:hypothetical protein
MTRENGKEIDDINPLINHMATSNERNSIDNSVFKYICRIHSQYYIYFSESSIKVTIK